MGVEDDGVGVFVVEWCIGGGAIGVDGAASGEGALDDLGGVVAPLEDLCWGEAEAGRVLEEVGFAGVVGFGGVDALEAEVLAAGAVFDVDF